MTKIERSRIRGIRMKRLLSAALLAATIAIFALLVDRALTLQERIRQLEIHNCGLVQYEDYSMQFQRDDAVRARCVEAMTLKGR